MDWIVREDLRENPNKLFLFGDNLEGVGFGGQAKEMRGEPNALGIPTKKKASHEEDSYMTDKEFVSNVVAINLALAKIPKENKIVVISKNGLGTGLAKLKEKAPKTFDYLQSKLKEIFN